MQIKSNKNEPQSIFIEPPHHTFIQNIDPIGVEFILHVFITQPFHNSHLPKRDIHSQLINK